MKSVSRSLFTVVILGLAGTVPTGAALAAAPSTHTEVPPTPARAPHGFVQILEEGLDEVTLRADQVPTVEQIVTQLEPLQARVDQAENAMLLTLAQQVREGKIDRTALETDMQAYVDARQEVSTDLRSTIQSLHSILDPMQRADLADAMESRIHAVRRALLSAERLDELAGALHLRQDQIEKIRDAMASIVPAMERERNALHKTLEAFRDDSFQIDEIMPKAQVQEHARQRAELIVDVTSTIVDLLDPSQRELLAERIVAATQARGEYHHHVDANTDEHTADASDAWIAARGPRGAFVARGGAARFAFGRARAYPVAAAWGFGW